MNCSIPGKNLKVLGKAIHSLAKIGDEIYLQASSDQLTIKTVNLSNTVFAIYKFLPAFFTHYSLTNTNDNSTSELKCKMPMKGILGVFKSPVQMEKQAEFCKIELQPNATKIIFKFRYKHDVSKTQSLWLLDGESVQIVFNNSIVPNIITAPASLYIQTLSNFQLTDDEISLGVNSQKMIIRNYIENENSRISHVRSQLSLNPGEFDLYKIGEDTSVTFSLKPFRAAVNFADYFRLGITVSFQSPGKPAALIMSNVVFEANFILATVHSNQNTQTSVMTSVPSLKLPEKEKGNPNLTAQDKKDLESIDWDNNFDTEIKQNNINNTDNSIINLAKRIQNKSNKLEQSQESQDNEVLTINSSPESPRSKKMRFLFTRCLDATYRASQLESQEIILAENSDDENDPVLNATYKI